ncbi:MAG: terpene cyclase/mutase family protein [Planctomycetota bacterium]|nr:terpene cyclase/mutase family protein [Planctomycetota bacterium]
MARYPHPALLLWLVLALPAFADERPPPPPAAVDHALERGVAWVLEEQRPQGDFGDVGETALAVLALQHAGLDPTHEGADARRLARALAWLDREAPGRRGAVGPKAGTYELALLLLVGRTRAEGADRAWLQRIADELVARQASNGQWWYDGKGAPDISAGDNSNTQFAVLALGLARAQGLDVPDRTFARTRSWWLYGQGDDGGFGYGSGGARRSASAASMTAAGIACLALIDAALGDQGSQSALRARAARDKATTWLGGVFSVTRNHGPTVDRRKEKQRNAGRGWLHYYLWSIERAMVLADQDRLAGQDWYALGAHRLLDTQARDGSWRQEAPLYATCFALLFLSRAADPPRAFTPASAAKRAPTKTPVTGEPVPDAADPAPAKEPAPPGEPTTWLTEELAPGVLADRLRPLGAGALLPLVAALDARDKGVRRRAWEALTALLPDDRTRGADRHPLARGRLGLWLRLHHPDLVLSAGRYVEP